MPQLSVTRPLSKTDFGEELRADPMNVFAGPHYFRERGLPGRIGLNQSGCARLRTCSLTSGGGFPIGSRRCKLHLQWVIRTYTRDSGLPKTSKTVRTS